MIRPSLFAALCTVSMGLAGSVPAQEVPETSLTKKQIEDSQGDAGVLTAAVSLLKAPEAVNAGGEGSASPPAKLGTRVELAGRQLADDLLRETAAMAGSAARLMAGPLTGALPGPTPNVVVGDATWERVENTTQAPFKSVCRVEVTWPNKATTTATASFVGARVLLTNAHVVYNSSRGGWATSVRVVPGKNGSSEPYGSLLTSLYFAPSEWLNGKEHNRDYDIAWIVLPNTTLYKKVGYSFGYQTTTDSVLKTADLNMSGYPGSKNGQQWREFVKTDQVVYPSQFRHYFDTVGGSSGSPMYRLTSGKRYVVGVNCAEVTSSPVYNIATRMTKRYFDSTSSYIKKYAK